MVKLCLVVPCYNEEEVLPETSRRLLAKLDALRESGRISPDSRILLVDDGSKDRTWELIERLHVEHASFWGVKLAHNRGHQNALFAGLMTAKEYADAVISLDADLQDDIDAIDRFLDAFEKGNDIVYGVRSARATDTMFKRGTARAFYGLMGKLGADIVPDHADYRLMSRRALEALSEYREVNLFLRGIVPLIGFSCAFVSYERHERFAGESKYPLRKMLAFAVDGVTSFSVKPIRMISGLGVLIFAVSALLLLYFLVVKLMGNAVQGWTTLALSIWALGGIQLFSLGVIGEYVGKVYQEVKARPKYLVETFLDDHR